MFDRFTDALVRLADHTSVEVFTLVGSFIEEVVAPIPSPIVMTVAGSLAHAQGYTFSYLFILSLIGATGKTIGALLVYAVAYHAGIFFVDRFGKYFGVKHDDIERLREKLDGGVKDLLLVTFFRALPIMSSAVVSIGCGVLRIGFWTYLIATIIGTVVRDFFYLYVGYSGVDAYYALVDGFDSVESVTQLAIGVAVTLFLGWLYWRRRRKKWWDIGR